MGALIHPSKAARIGANLNLSPDLLKAFGSEDGIALLQREMQKRQKLLHYRKNPLAWMDEVLGIAPETIRWSIYPKYKSHKWDDKDPNLVTPDPLYQMLMGMAEGKDVGIEAATGLGKAQPLTEKVLTPSGWSTMGDLNVGDYVIGADGRPTQINGVFPQGVRSGYRVVFNDGSEVLCDEDHLWAVRTRWDTYKNRPYRTLTAKEIKRSLENEDDTRDWWIPVVEPVEHQEKEFAVDPYLLGVLIGDGGMTGKYVTLSTGDDFIVREAKKRIPDSVVLKYSSAYDYRIVQPGGQNGGSKNPFTEEFVKMGLMGKRSEDKYVPVEYMTGSVDQRLALLQGLMDSDGYCLPSGTTQQFASSSKRLRDDVVALAQSLGGTATKTKKKTQGLDSYMTCVRLPNGMNPFRLPRKADLVKDRTKYKPARKIISIEPVGQMEMQCISVDAEDSLYVTKDYVVTHNTFLAAAVALWFVDCYRREINEEGKVIDPGGLVVLVATKADQIRDGIWKEIGNFRGMFRKRHPDAEWMDLKLRMDPDSELSSKEGWGIIGKTASVGADEEVSTAFQGIHAPHMLFICDEATGIHPAILEAIENTLTGDHNFRLMLGNPNSQSDTLHRFCTQPDVLHLRASALDHPNVVHNQELVPGATTRGSIARRIRKYKDPNHHRILTRVHGISPTTSGLSMFPDEVLQSTKPVVMKGPVKAFKVPKPSEGTFKIYAPPKHDLLGRYLIFCDVAGDRSDSGDYHAAICLDRTDMSIAAVLHMRGPRTDLVTELLRFAKLYTIPYGDTGEVIETDDGDIKRVQLQFAPLLAYESNNVGGLHMDPRLLEYDNLWHQKRADTQKTPSQRQGLGWNTNRQTRPDMMDNLEEWALDLYDHPTRLSDKGVWEEAKTFSWNDSARISGGKWEAEPGCHDDLIMALAGALTINKIERGGEQIETSRYEPPKETPETKYEEIVQTKSYKDASGNQTNNPFEAAIPDFGESTPFGDPMF